MNLVDGSDGSSSRRERSSRVVRCRPGPRAAPQPRQATALLARVGLRGRAARRLHRLGGRLDPRLRVSEHEVARGAAARAGRGPPPRLPGGAAAARAAGRRARSPGSSWPSAARSSWRRACPEAVARPHRPRSTLEAEAPGHRASGRPPPPRLPDRRDRVRLMDLELLTTSASTDPGRAALPRAPGLGVDRARRVLLRGDDQPAAARCARRSAGELPFSSLRRQRGPRLRRDREGAVRDRATGGRSRRC